jgi:hypothetical protein
MESNPKSFLQGVCITLQGDSGSSYLLQSSADRIGWSDAGNVVASGGIAQISQPLTGSMRYYQAISR